MRISNVLAALSLSGALVLGNQVPVQAAPVTALSAAAKPDGPAGQVVQVRFGGFHGGGFHGGWGGGFHRGWGGGWRGGGWHGGGWGWGLGGLAAGALIGAAVASSSPYYWGDPYYAYGGYPVAYAAPVYRPYYGPYWRRRVIWGGGWGWGPGW
jgi:hypothetical protein